MNAWEKKLCNAHHQSAFNVLRALGLRCSRDQSSHREDVKEYGAGRLKRWAAKLSVSSNIGAYFMGGSPQQVQVKYNDVYSVSIGSVNELRIRSITDNVDHYELHIKTPGFREKFKFP